MRYLGFSGENYHADGGMLDLAAHGYEKDDVVRRTLLNAEANLHAWFHVYDLEECEVVALCSGERCGFVFQGNKNVTGLNLSTSLVVYERVDYKFVRR